MSPGSKLTETPPIFLKKYYYRKNAILFIRGVHYLDLIIKITLTQWEKKTKKFSGNFLM